MHGAKIKIIYCELLGVADLRSHNVHNDGSEPASEVYDYNKNKKMGHFI
jgi:hypothetical protein